MSVTVCALMLGPVLFAGTGCSRSIVAGDRIRPGPFADVLQRTEQARGIRLDFTVDSRVVSSTELREVVERAALAGWPGNSLFGDYQESLVAVGLWPPGRDLLEEFTATVGEEAVGLYVPSERALFIVSNPRVPMSVKLASAIARRDLSGRDFVRELALAHELVHVLQHQAYPALIDVVTSTNDQDDLTSAVQAALEGDAVLFGLRTFEPTGPVPPPVDFAANLRKQAGEGSLASSPRLIREAVLFPYSQGYRLAFLETLLLLDSPPFSTEQVFHHDKRREGFWVMDMSGLEDRLGHECERLYENTMGELGMSILFAEHDAAVAPAAWQGWDGDRYFVARCGDTPEFVWETRWDTEADADEFAAAYEAIAPSVAEAAGRDGATLVRRHGPAVVVATGELGAVTDDMDGVIRRSRVSTMQDMLAFFEHDETRGSK